MFSAAGDCCLHERKRSCDTAIPSMSFQAICCRLWAERMDVPSLVIVVLLALFLLVIGEILRAFIDGRVLAPPWHRKPLQLNLLVFCAALFVWMAIPVTIALALRLKEAALQERLEAQTLANLLIFA